eukprot:CAMPEP_0113515558 /NCGR_PEP_ID=MMETSP0014_2-20120614/41042_1 /TAXON_ID=2857 /ORGANISM="Nitzschia sp." /LENGTH=53 /DNA_ID=CAMNT_0000412201 /DNA_START=1 /DNA_END=159 /DNA_ORIENTATION=+ /assembly_acc=CAM_ASM_000159
MESEGALVQITKEEYDLIVATPSSDGKASLMARGVSYWSDFPAPIGMVLYVVA